MSAEAARLPFSVAFTLTSEDVVRAYRAHAASQVLGRKALVATGVTFILVAVILVSLMPDDPFGIGLILTASVIGGAAYPLFMLRWYIPRIARRIYAQQQDLRSEIGVSVDAEALRARIATGDTRTPWSHFIRWREDAHVVLLYRSDLLFQFVPKRVLSEAQIEAMRLLAAKTAP